MDPKDLILLIGEQTVTIAILKKQIAKLTAPTTPTSETEKA